MKRLWIHFIQAKVYFLETERKEEAIFFEDFHGTQDIADFYDLVKSPPSKTPTKDSEFKKGSATKTIQSTLDPIKSQSLMFQ